MWGRHFTVRTDHYALKFLLDQRLSTVPQHQWVSKLFGFDFSVEYWPGRLNTVADALSRRSDEVATRDVPDVLLGALSGPSFQLYNILRRELHDALSSGPSATRWSLTGANCGALSTGSFFGAPKCLSPRRRSWCRR
jgi:hypothetical protein